MLLKKIVIGIGGETMSNKNSKYQLICGLETHAELKTNSKMFCGCKNDPFGAEKPNTYTCPVCLGMPGALPVANKKAIEWTIKLGLALNCKINLFSKFDRKHYFYPDLPKGYQISQYDLPFCYDGFLDTSEGRIGITRIHLEEDTAKLQHKTVDGKKVSLVDFNRSSVPLVEIVTEPDIKSASQAAEYGHKLRDIIRYLEIGDCNMQEGGMRLEANISLTPDLSENPTLPDYKVELKNINSFRFMEAAIEYEIKRHTKLLDNGETPIQETRGWNSKKQESFSQRIKESAEDYRYFPNPDLPPLQFTKEQIEEWKNELPMLPAEVMKLWNKKYKLETRYASQLLTTQAAVEFLNNAFAIALKKDIKPNHIAKEIVNKNIKLDLETTPLQLIESYQKLHQTDDIDVDELQQAIKKIMLENPDAVRKYQAGKKQVVGFLLGQVAKTLAKKLDMKQVRSALLQALEA